MVKRSFIMQFWICAFLSVIFSQASTARDVIDFNLDWQFSGADAFGEVYQQQVNLPHSWNGAETWNEALNKTVSLHYSRNLNRYQKNFIASNAWRGKKLFIHLGAANTVARVSVNRILVGEHRGGYSAFNFDITEFVKIGEENTVEISVDNSANDDIMPLFGDFNVYGGLIRPVNLIVSEKSMISLGEHGSSGVYVKQKKLSAEIAEIEVRTHVDHQDALSSTLTLVTSVFDDRDELVNSTSTNVSVDAQSKSQHLQSIHLENPRRWQGTTDPYLYRVNVSLYQEGKLLDEINEPLGLRDFSIDQEGSLLLNGKIYRLKGVGLHEDWPGVGPALSTAQRTLDIELIKSMGANAIRLAHYPHSKETLTLADKAGLLVWSEIPFVGSPFGPPVGYTNSQGFKDNAKQQLLEMIHQQFNHPSVFFWGIFNELPTKVTDDFNPLPLVRELNAMAKELDPSRLTTSASLAMDEESNVLNTITDVQFWNRYFGWYNGKPEDVGPWLDATKKIFPRRGIGISEYGAGGSVTSYQEKLAKPYAHGDRDHPEKWQSYLHQRAWNELKQRDFVIGSFVWVMFDFSSSLRKEGGHDGLNTKGLVSYDRKVTKDAFHFYQASWSDKPVLYIAGRRSIARESASSEVKVFSNGAEVELWNNHESLGKQHGDNGVFIWTDVDIVPGNNLLVARTESGGQLLSDRAIWYYDDQLGLISKLMPIFAERWSIVIATLVMLCLFYSWGYLKQSSNIGVIIAKTGFWVLSITLVLYLLALLALQIKGLLTAFY